MVWGGIYFKRTNMIAIVLGTRPEIIKNFSVIKELQKHRERFCIIHTGQHYSKNMDRLFFDELKLPFPKYNLEVKEASNPKMIAEMMIKVETILNAVKPDWVVVQGDTNSTLSGALTAAILNIKVAHIESGLRSYDRNMPEEINRIIIDHISDVLFCPTVNQKNVLLSEGINTGRVSVVGNTIVDAIKQNINKTNLKNYWKKADYFLLTLHRPSNVDNRTTLIRIFSTLKKLAIKYKVKIVFPAHPRLLQNIIKFKIRIDSKYVEMFPGVGFLEMLDLEKNSKLILTDSGGIQEEACVLKVPCVTLRYNTERPETIVVGANLLAGNTESGVFQAVAKMLTVKRNWKNPFGNGKSGAKIVDYLLRNNKK